MTKSVHEIAALLKGEVAGDKSVQIHSVGSIESATEGQLAFAFSKEHLARLEETSASCIVVPREFNTPSKKTLIKAPNPREALISMLHFFYKPDRKKPGVHKLACVSESSKIGQGAYVGPFAVIEDEAAIGDNSTIEAGVFVGKGSKVGNGSLVYPNVTIYHDCFVGNNVIIHSGTVIGSDGFGFIQKDGIQHKIPQIGKVIIEDDVEIGSNVSVDRATIGETVIGKGTKIDNLVQIAHNVRIGQNVIIAGEAGIAGSAVIEDNAIIAAQAGIKDHVRIGKGAIVGASSAVKDDVEPGKVVVGYPAKDGREFAREVAAISRLTTNINNIFRLIKDQKD